MATAAVQIPPSNHGISGSHMLVQARLPEAVPKLKHSDIDVLPPRIAADWVDNFNKLLEGVNIAIDKLFIEDSYWRDLLCSTWDFHTYQGHSKITSALKDNQGCRLTSLEIDASSDRKEPSVCPIDFNGTVQGIQAFLTVKTTIGRGRGLVRLVQDLKEASGQTPSEGWKAFTLFTCLEELTGHEESTGTRRPTGVDHGAHPGRLNWQQRRDAEANCEPPFSPTVVIIGRSCQWLLVTHVSHTFKVRVKEA